MSDLKKIKKRDGEVDSDKKGTALAPISVREPEPEKSKREVRLEKRDKKYSDQIATEAGKYAIDLSQKPNMPVTEKIKSDITNNIKKATSQEFATDIDNFSKTYSPPPTVDVPELNQDELKKSLRRQRLAKWADALSAFGKGLSGRSVDPNNFATTRLKRGREQQFQNYKAATEKNKQVAEVWKTQYRNDLLNFIDSKIQDKNTTEAERKKYQLAYDQLNQKQNEAASQLKFKQDELKAKQNAGYFKKSNNTKPSPLYTQQLDDGNWQVTNQKNPYSDLYYKLTGNSPTLINEMAKMAGHAVEDDGNLKRNLSSDEIERFSNTLLSRMFDFQSDKDGNQVAIPKPGMENYINDLSGQIDQVNQLQEQLQSVSDEFNMKYASAKNRNKDDVEAEFNPKINELDAQLQEAQSNLQDLLNGTPASEKTKKKLNAFFGE